MNSAIRTKLHGEIEAIRGAFDGEGLSAEINHQLAQAKAAVTADNLVECRRLLDYVRGRNRRRTDVVKAAGALIDRLTVMLGFPLPADHRTDHHTDSLNEEAAVDVEREDHGQGEGASEAPADDARPMVDLAAMKKKALITFAGSHQIKIDQKASRDEIEQAIRDDWHTDPALHSFRLLEEAEEPEDRGEGQGE